MDMEAASWIWRQHHGYGGSIMDEGDSMTSEGVQTLHGRRASILVWLAEVGWEVWELFVVFWQVGCCMQKVHDECILRMVHCCFTWLKFVTACDMELIAQSSRPSLYMIRTNNALRTSFPPSPWRLHRVSVLTVLNCNLLLLQALSRKQQHPAMQLIPVLPPCAMRWGISSNSPSSTC